MIKKITYVLIVFFQIILILSFSSKCALSSTPQSKTSEITLTVSHIGPPNWPIYTEVIKPWMDQVEKRSNGEIHFKVYSGKKLGQGQEKIDILINGTVDISSSVCDYSRDKFPLSSVMKLPFIGESGERASLVLWSVYKKFLKNEYKDIKVLSLFCHGPGHIHTITKEVKTPNDLKGLRIRVSDEILGKVITKLGGQPVIDTVDHIKELIIEKKIDGYALPWEGVTSFGLMDLSQYHTEINMYTLPLYIAMNKQTYESLPSHLRKIIDETAGEGMSIYAGSVFDKKDKIAKQIAIEKNHTIIKINKKDIEQWRKLTMSIGDQWIDEMHKKNLPGQKVLSYVVDLYLQLD